MSVDDDTSWVRDVQYVADVNTAEMAVNEKSQVKPIRRSKAGSYYFPNNATILDTSGMLGISIIALYYFNSFIVPRPILSEFLCVKQKYKFCWFFTILNRIFGNHLSFTFKLKRWSYKLHWPTLGYTENTDVALVTVPMIRNGRWSFKNRVVADV